MEKDALISSDGKYRYRLSRIWDGTIGNVVFIGLNPSTADANLDDPTIRRCIGFAKDWGFGGLTMLNLFAYRATNPKELKKVADPIGPKNLNWLRFYARQAIVCCWGSDPMAKDWSKEVLKLIPRPMALAFTKDGHPRHPLYLKKSLTPIGFKKGVSND